jgi:hypothetical protein
MSDHMPTSTIGGASPGLGPAKQIASIVRESRSPLRTSGNIGANSSIPDPSSDSGACAAKSALIAKSEAHAHRTTAKKPPQRPVAPQDKPERPACIANSKALRRHRKFIEFSYVMRIEIAENRDKLDIFIDKNNV